MIIAEITLVLDFTFLLSIISKMFNPTLSHSDKVMQALADCVKMLKGGNTSTGMQEMDGLKQLVETTQLRMQCEPHKTLKTDSTSGQQHTLPRVQPVPRVDIEQRDDRCTSRAMAQEASRSTLPAPIAECIKKIAKTRSKKSRMTARAPPPLLSSDPAHNTRSKTAAVAKQAAPPAMGTRSK